MRRAILGAAGALALAGCNQPMAGPPAQRVNASANVYPSGLRINNMDERPMQNCTVTINRLYKVTGIALEPGEAMIIAWRRFGTDVSHGTFDPDFLGVSNASASCANGVWAQWS